MMGINVLSLFDGMSCGQQALECANISVDKYFASEIDKHAIKVTMVNYPGTIQLGSVVSVDVNTLPKIDLLIGGSPCQSFSFAGKRKGMSTKCETEILTLQHYLQLKSEDYEFEGQSYLFWEYMRILTDIRKTNPNVKFLLENVMMGAKWQKILTRAIGINPIEINSALVSAQNRRRLYWTNIGAEPDGLFGELYCKIKQPKDKGILLKDVLEPQVDDKYYLSENAIQGILKHKEKEKEKGNGFGVKFHNEDEKMSSLKIGGKGVDDIIVHNTMPRSGDPSKGVPYHLSRGDGKTYCLDTGNTNAVEIIGGDYRMDEGFRFRNNGRSATLNTKESCGNIVQYSHRIRRLTPTECERLQTCKDGYTAHVSDTQRYRMLGNGWTVDVIAHIFQHLIIEERK